MASRSRKEFRGRDFQRLSNLIKAVHMVQNMDVERANYNAKDANISKPNKLMFAAWAKVSTALKTIEDRASVLLDLNVGKEDPGV